MKHIDHQQQQNLLETFFRQSRPSGTHPILYVMAGIPASGKTTFVKKQETLNKLPVSHYYHDPDMVMEHLEEYQFSLQTVGAEEAKQLWELPARNFADDNLFPKALSDRVNIVMDMGMCRTKILNMVHTCRDRGYYVHMHIIYCNLNEAINRSRERKRFVSSDIIKERARFFAINLNSILSLSDTTRAYNNSTADQPYDPLSIQQLKSYVKSDYECS